MELGTYWKILIRRWWLVLAPVAAVILYVAVTYVPPGPVYQVVMRFAAGTRPASLSEDYDRYYPWLTSEYVANGLADVAETGAFAQAVARAWPTQGTKSHHRQFSPLSSRTTASLSSSSTSPGPTQSKSSP